VGAIDEHRAARRHLKPKTINLHLTLLISMLNVAVELGWIASRPRIRKPKVSLFPTDFRCLVSTAEVRRFLSAAREIDEDVQACAIRTRVRTVGCARSERPTDRAPRPGGRLPGSPRRSANRDPKIPQTLSGELAPFRLPWSHSVRLMSVRSEFARAFYESEALRGGRSVRQLEHQIGSQFYERTALSRNKAAMLRKGAVSHPEDAVSPEEVNAASSSTA